MNQKKKIYLKCSEELLELSTCLIQDLNKSKDHTTQIINEIKDVEKQLKKLKQILKI